MRSRKRLVGALSHRPFAGDRIRDGLRPAAPGGKEELTAAYRDLDQRRYDQAFSEAGAFLEKNPTGPGSAEAVYLQGRIYEARAESAGTAGRADEARSDLTTAANTYLRVLQLSPPPAVEGLAHAGLANAAFYLEDYATAAREWGLAYPLVGQPDARSWILYRVGLCQQRLGQFDLADRSFARVQQEFPGKEPATRAAAHAGQRAFYVRVGAYGSAAAADREVAKVRAKGLAGALRGRRGDGPPGRAGRPLRDVRRGAERASQAERVPRRGRRTVNLHADRPVTPDRSRSGFCPRGESYSGSEESGAGWPGVWGKSVDQSSAAGASAASINSFSSERWQRASRSHADEQSNVIVSPALTRAASSCTFARCLRISVR